MTELATAAPRLELTRPPQNEDELWHVVKALWGIELPRQQICPDHVAPFTAFAHAYFATYPNWALWYGSRGTGKSYMLALLGLTKAAVSRASSQASWLLGMDICMNLPANSSFWDLNPLLRAFHSP